MQFFSETVSIFFCQHGAVCGTVCGRVGSHQKNVKFIPFVKVHRYIYLACIDACMHYLMQLIMHFFNFQGPRCYHVPCFMESSEYFMKSHEQLDQKNWNLLTRRADCCCWLCRGTSRREALAEQFPITHGQSVKAAMLGQCWAHKGRTETLKTKFSSPSL